MRERERERRGTKKFNFKTKIKLMIFLEKANWWILKCNISENCNLEKCVSSRMEPIKTIALNHLQRFIHILSFPRRVRFDIQAQETLR